MDIKYKKLKNDLKQAHNKYFKQYKYYLENFESKARLSVEKWCFRVIDTLLLIKYSSLSEQSKEEAFSYYTQIIECLVESRAIKLLESLLEQIQKLIIRCLVTPLNVLEEEFEQIYSESLAKTKDTPDKYSLISVTIYFIIRPQQPLLFSDFWNDSAKDLFRICFSIQDNEYMRNYSKLILCGLEFYQDDSSAFIDNEKIFVLLEIIFHKSKNFKYFLKASKIYLLMKNQPIIEDQDLSNANVKLKILKAPNNSFELIGKEFKICLNKNINQQGAKEEHKDSQIHTSNFFTIGTHKLANIRLDPTNYPIDHICFAIFFNGRNFLMVDCAKYNFTQIKMKPFKPHITKKGTMLNLANKGILHVIDFKITDNHKRDRFEIELKYEYLTGPFSQVPLGSREKVVNTYKKNEDSDKLIFGRGGKGFHIDVFADLVECTSKQHMCFYLNEDEDLCVNDMDTKNGTFLLMKDHQQNLDCKWSDVYPVFPHFKTFDTICLPEEKLYLTRLDICEYKFEIEAEKI